METKSSSAQLITTKKLCNKAKIAFYMFRKALAKTKLLVDLHINLKDGKLARKAITSLLLHHHYAAATTCGCTSNNIDTLFISPQRHKLQSSTGASKCKSHQHHANDKQVVIEMSNDGGSTIEPSPLVLEAPTAVGRELRANDGGFTIEPSPLVLAAPTAVGRELRANELSLREDDECQVDKAAEEFIKKFYEQLKQQHITFVESPSPNHLWAQ